MAGSVQGTVKEKLRAVSDAYTAFQEGLEPRQQRLFHVLSFLSRFALLAIPFYLVLGSGWDASGLRTVTAQVSAATLQILGIEASSSGSFVSAGELLVDVTRDSTGWKSVVVFSALVVAAQRRWKSKITAIAVGTALIIGVNLFRITSMVYAVEVFGLDYEVLHTLLWRWGLTGAVIGLWASWMWLSAPSPVPARLRGR